MLPRMKYEYRLIYRMEILKYSLITVLHQDRLSDFSLLAPAWIKPPFYLLP